MALGCGSAERESSKGVEFYAPPRANSFAIQRGARSRGYPPASDYCCGCAGLLLARRLILLDEVLAREIPMLHIDVRVRLDIALIAVMILLLL